MILIRDFLQNSLKVTLATQQYLCPYLGIRTIGTFSLQGEPLLYPSIAVKLHFLVAGQILRMTLLKKPRFARHRRRLVYYLVTFKFSARCVKCGQSAITVFCLS
jgi:hypothetical protein